MKIILSVKTYGRKDMLDPNEETHLKENRENDSKTLLFSQKHSMKVFSQEFEASTTSQEARAKDE